MCDVRMRGCLYTIGRCVPARHIELKGRPAPLARMGKESTVHSSFVGNGALFTGGWWRARKEMAKLVARYDSSTVEESVLEALVAAGASEAAAVMAEGPSTSQVRTYDRRL